MNFRQYFRHSYATLPLELFRYCLILSFISVSCYAQTPRTEAIQSRAKFGLENELRDPVTRITLMANPVGLTVISLLIGALSPSDLDVNISSGALMSYLGLYYISILGAIFPTPLYYNKFAYFLRSRLIPEKAGVKMLDGRFIDEDTGLWLERGSDPFVIEVRSKPSTLSEYEQSIKTLDAAMFEPLFNMGIGGARFLANGHFHLDIESAFDGDIRLFRDFIADLLKWPGLLEGVFAQNFANTGSMFESSRKLRQYSEAIYQALEKVDSGEIDEIPSLIEALISAGMVGATPSVGINYFKGSIELRFLRSANSSEELLAYMRLIQARIDYLRENRGVSLKLPSHRMSFAGKVNNLKLLVEETGLEWDDYRVLMTPLQRLRYGVGKKIDETLDAVARCSTLLTGLREVQ